MKFSGSFTAFVVASVATANLAAAAPIGQVNTQSTSQSSTSPSIQTSNANQDNEQNAFSSNRFNLENKVDNSRNYDVDIDNTENNTNNIDVDYKKDELDYHPTFVKSKPTVVTAPVKTAPVKAVPVKAAPVKVAPVVPVKVDNSDNSRDQKNFRGVQNAYVERRGNGAAFGAQGASANGAGGSSWQGQSNQPVVSGQGNSITTGGSQGSQNDGIGGTITQSLSQALQKRLLFANGQQAASADAFGGKSHQGQLNSPVVSGAGNSITTGGQQGADNSATGGQIAQKLIQQLTSRDVEERGLGSMLGLTGGAPGGAPAAAPLGGGLPTPQGGAPSFGFAGAQQNAGANGFGGFSKQGQQNRPVLSGVGNSLTTGGAQGSENSAKGGSIGQELLQKLQKRQLGNFFGNFGGAPAQGGKAAYGSQGASANGQGGYSSQLQSNRPVVSGFGNSVTTGGSQGATNNGQGGSITQSLEQLLSRDVQGQAQGQGVGQGTFQAADSNARGGNAFVVGANGPVALDGSARGGSVVQTSGSKQAAGQSATQDASYTTQNNFAARPYWRRNVQGQGQGIGQGTGQYGSAAATGGNAFVAGANGPVFVKTAAQGGAVQQGSASEQQGYQSATQANSATQQNNLAYGAPWFRREVQGTSQGSSQSTSQSASSDAKAGDVNVIDVDHDDLNGWVWTHDPEFRYAPQVIDTSAKAGAVSQKSESNQANSQKSGTSNKSNKSNNVDFQRRTVEITHDFVHDTEHVTYLRDFTHDATHIVRVAGAKDKRQLFQGQTGSANAAGGHSFDFQNNEGLPVTGNGLTATYGGPQSSSNSATGGSLTQLLNPQQ